MIFRDAHGILQRVLAPMPPEQFFDEVLGRKFIKLDGEDNHYRRTLLGNDPESVIVAAFRDLAPNMAFHAVDAKGPPPSVEAVPDARAFKNKVDAFQSLGYTVRLPQPRWLSPGLEEFLRALEFFFHQPVRADAFWSREGARAPAHYDDTDLIVIPIKGRKRWFINSDPSELPNPWRSGPTPSSPLTRHTVVEVKPGDLLYLPRGTDHRVDALSDALHISVAFVPLTLREAIGAMLDHLSDFDRPFRESVGNRLAYAIRSNNFADIAPRVRDGLARLMHVCGSDDFIAEALQRRSSRAIGDFKKPKTGEASAAISAATRVRHSPSVMAHVTASPELIDFSHPGGHVYIRRGVEPCVLYIAETAEFRVGDIPGDIGDDVRIALVEKFLASGFLEVVGQ